MSRGRSCPFYSANQCPRTNLLRIKDPEHENWSFGADGSSSIPFCVVETSSPSRKETLEAASGVREAATLHSLLAQDLISERSLYQEAKDVFCIRCFWKQVPKPSGATM